MTFPSTHEVIAPCPNNKDSSDSRSKPILWIFCCVPGLVPIFPSLKALADCALRACLPAEGPTDFLCFLLPPLLHATAWLSLSLIPIPSPAHSHPRYVTCFHLERCPLASVPRRRLASIPFLKHRASIMKPSRLSHAFQKLIARIAKLARPSKKRSPDERSPLSISKPYSSHPDAAIMADQEEDFSSIPLPDRFTHKVCYLSPSPASATNGFV